VYTNCITRKCQVKQEILAAKQKLRALAYLQPRASDGDAFTMVAVELLRRLDRHQDNCGLCQTALEHRGELSWSASANLAGPMRPAIAEGA
jgi:hypothetical protein